MYSSVYVCHYYDLKKKRNKKNQTPKYLVHWFYFLIIIIFPCSLIVILGIYRCVRLQIKVRVHATSFKFPPLLDGFRLYVVYSVVTGIYKSHLSCAPHQFVTVLPWTTMFPLRTTRPLRRKHPLNGRRIRMRAPVMRAMKGRGLYARGSRRRRKQRGGFLGPILKGLTNLLGI